MRFFLLLMNSNTTLMVQGGLDEALQTDRSMDKWNGVMTKRFDFHSTMARTLLLLGLLLPLFPWKATAATPTAQGDGPMVVQKMEEAASETVSSQEFLIFSKREGLLSLLVLYGIIQLFCHERRKEDGNGLPMKKSRREWFRTKVLPILLCVLYVIAMGLWAYFREP